ncbi:MULTISPECIES: hypothetical protein [Leptospirillum]|uniref:hypothetical protein n=1 Tax=Leptospirillum TaxID=179 RepID=UPI0002D66E0A|nr:MULTISPECIES: hypothetical protein [Leptospirillum]
MTWLAGTASQTGFLCAIRRESVLVQAGTKAGRPDLSPVPGTGGSAPRPPKG